MSQNVIQPSFAGGELAPSLFARVDLAKYHTGAALMRNFFVDYRSGASTRPGTKFVIQAYNSTKPVRLIRFEYSVLATYILEFGDHYVRFISDGASVLQTGFAITGISNTNPMGLTAPGNDFANGDWIFVSGVVGMPQVNNRFFSIVGSVFCDVNGVPVNSTTWGTYVSGGTAAKVYKIASPYAAEDLALLKFAQLATAANSLTITHPSYAPQTLTITAPTNWAFTTIVFGSTAVAPTGVGAVVSTVGTTNYAYVVTSVDANGQESLPSAIANLPLAADITAVPATITVSWTPAAGAVSYNVYQAELSYAGAVPTGAAFGFVGQATGSSFIISNLLPNFDVSVPVAKNPFAGNNPSCVACFQQRATYAASMTLPLTFWMSQPGEFNNFNESSPIQDDDAITGTLVSNEVNAIKNLIPMPGGLIALTAKGAWQISGGQANVAVTPANIVATPQAYNGASDVPPIVVNYDILYVQAKGSIVRDLSYNFYTNIYTGTDISVLSNHLFYGHNITEWAYAEEPFKIVWAVRNDGIMLSLTFVKEQEIYGWAHSDSLGLAKSVASVTEGQADAVYFVIARFIQGRWVQMIERLADRVFEYGAEDAWSVDCGVRSTLPTPTAVLNASSSSGVATFTATAASPVFTSANVGSILRMGGGIATITAYVDGYTLIGTLTRDIREVIPNDPLLTPAPAAAGTWSITAPASTFYGADHLEGQTVSILADGGVITSQVVTGGAITLANPATKVVLGLGFTAQLQTMYLDVGDPTIQGKRKKIPALTVRVAESRGLKAGMTFDTLVDIKELNRATILNEPIELISHDERLIMDPLWDVTGQICLQTSNPLPVTVLGVIPEIVVGDTVK